MTRSVYVIGGAGTGKSTFMSQLLDRLLDGDDMGPLEDLYSKPNKKNVVTLRGHFVGEAGMYLGKMRSSYPGTDGLDRATSPAGAEWLELGMHSGLSYIVAEGATLATRPFLSALYEHTNLLLIHLWVDEFVRELRFAERGSNQPEQFVRQTATRSANLLEDMRKLGVSWLSLNTADPSTWERGLTTAHRHLQN